MKKKLCKKYKLKLEYRKRLARKIKGKTSYTTTNCGQPKILPFSRFILEALAREQHQVIPE